MKPQCHVAGKSAVILYTLLIGALFATTGPLLPSWARNRSGAPIIGVRLVGAIAPTIDYSHNMRVLKLPKSVVQIGDLIYRLKGSDADASQRLTFGSASALARSLLDIVPVSDASHWNEADVYLRASLQEPVYNLTIFVSDGTNKTTQVESMIIATDALESLSSVAANVSSLASQPPPPTTTSSAREPFADERRPTATSLAAAAAFASPNHFIGCNSTSRLNALLESAAALESNGALRFSPFVRPKQVFSVAENARVGEPIGSLSVLERADSDLAVRFELRGSGADHFAIRYVFGPRGQARGELQLARALDYETQNMFQLKVLALNAWTNRELDTRNVHTLDIVIAVTDVQDTGPVFNKPALVFPRFAASASAATTSTHATGTQAHPQTQTQTAAAAAATTTATTNAHAQQVWQPIQVSNRMRVGDLLTKVEARDGDSGDQRPVQYALDASSQLAEYFDIDKLSGAIRLARPVDELAALAELIGLDSQAAADGATPFQLSVFATEVPDTSSYEHLWPPMYARLELPLQLVDAENEPPEFATRNSLRRSADARTGEPVLHAYLVEPGRRAWQRAEAMGAPLRPMVQWRRNASAAAAANGDGDASGPQLMVVDSNRGANGTFELSLEGADAHLFAIEPNYAVVRRTHVNLFVRLRNDQASRGSLWLETGHPPQDRNRVFQVTLVARDFGSGGRLAARAKVAIELVDAASDSAPQFESELYVFSVYENSQAGTIVGSVRARGDLQAAAAAPTAAPEVRYTSLTGADNNLFKVDPESGLLTLAEHTGTHLDRERADNYLFVVEARNSNTGASNYTRVMINVLDVNDNAPVFSQASYDAVLIVAPVGGSTQTSGAAAAAAAVSFQQPLVVRASDADEPNTANSQVAYEIIAGNSNELFTIDSLSGAIYPTGAALPPQPPPPPTTLPSILADPIRPIYPTPLHSLHTQQHSPGREIEETTTSGRFGGPSQPQPREPRQRSDEDELAASKFGRANGSAAQSSSSSPPPLNSDLVQATDLLLTLESSAIGSEQTFAPHPTSTAAAAAAAAAATTDQSAPRTRLLPTAPTYSSGAVWSHLPPPVTTLVVRAHDFGIPLRSSTAKVNIYNPILSTRYLSVILNGTAEQLEQRRDSIERTFGAVVGAKAAIESIDALSDSSQLSVARIRLTVPQSNLVDLTDLSALSQALELRSGGAQVQSSSSSSSSSSSQQRQPQVQPPESGRIDSTRHTNQGPPVTHYVAIGDRLIPTANITSIGAAAAPPPLHHYTDIQSYALDASALERKLLIYIIIVGVCILALLVIWMVYSCSRENELKVVETHATGESLRDKHCSALAATTTSAARRSQQSQTGESNKTHAKSRMLAAPIANQLYGKQQPLVIVPANDASRHRLPAAAAMLHQQQQRPLWFEPNYDRLGRASSAPSSGVQQLNSSAELLGPLDGALYATIAAGGARRPSVVERRSQFFPNTIGYTENLSAILSGADRTGKRRTVGGGRRKVAPLSPASGGGHLNRAFEADDDDEDDYGVEDDDDSNNASRKRAHSHRNKRKRHAQQTTGVQTSLNGSQQSQCSATLADGGGGGGAAHDESSLGAESVVLDSDQELLGFDSSGAPIIATHTGAPATGRRDEAEADPPPSLPPLSLPPPPPPPPQETKPAGAGPAKSAAASSPAKRPLQRQTADESCVVAVRNDDDGKEEQVKETSKAVGGGGGGGDLRAATDKRVRQPKSAQVSDSATGSEQKPSTRSATAAAATTTMALNKSEVHETGTGALRAKMKNGEVLERQSIFAMTYSGVATDKLPAI